MLRPSVLNMRDIHIMIISAPRRVNIKIVPTNDVDDSKVIEKFHVSSKILSIIEDTSVPTHWLTMKSTYLLMVPVMMWMR